MPLVVILMMILGAVEGLQRDDLRRDRLRETPARGQGFTISVAIGFAKRPLAARAFFEASASSR
jgi:hypothetical protein